MSGQTPDAPPASTGPWARSTGHTRPGPSWGRTARLAITGGLGFWVANLAISLTPVAAWYRTALSIAYLPMLLEALAGGLVLGVVVAGAVARFGDRIPPANPFFKAVTVSLVILLAVTLVVDLPAKLLTARPDAVLLLATGVAIDAIRILALGAAIGSQLLHDQVDAHRTPE